ncbi:MAG: RluA family pseudouridine synthase [Ruminococcus sp.]|nr:RluA family pseudouridine synthase [Ruminococcus sp.]
MPEQLKFSVEEKHDNMQAKRYLKRVHGLSTRLITRLKNTPDGILMDGKLLRAVDFVKAGAVITVNLPDEQSEYIEPVEGKLEILYEDSFILAVNKPPFMPVHPVKQHQTDTLANIIVYYARQRGESYVFRAHNRLDRDTSGIVLIAKDKFTINKLKNGVKKTYTALVHGKIENGGTIAKPIGLLDDSKMVRHVLSEGTPAITHYAPLAFNEQATLLNLQLETGKTHQIRCHMSSMGHPLVGDDLYGGKRDFINRQALHCGTVEFTHPVTSEIITVTAPLPNDIENAVKQYNI